MAPSPRKQLTADDWVTAGFAALAEGGLDAVAVERVAVRLGATKGSFYWHFSDRSALVEAVMGRWRDETEEIIEAVEGIADPRERLRRLFETVTAHIPVDRSEVDLLGRSGPPSVVAAREDVSRRRITFMADAFRECGLTPVAARDRAVQAYALWIGLLELQVALPGTVPEGRARARFLRSTNDLLATLVG